MSPERVIDVRRQARMSFAKTVRLCLSGIAHRFFRSVLTLAVVVLAVAFFMTLLSENRFIAASAAGVAEEIRLQREAVQWLGSLLGTPSAAAHSRLLARADGEPARRAECAAVARWEPDRVARLAASSAAEQRYLAFLEGLDRGRRAVLVRRAQGREAFAYLAGAGAWESFARNLAAMRSVRVPGGPDAFRAFLAAYPAHAAELEAFAADWRRRVGEFAAAAGRLTGGLPPEAWLAGADDAGLAAFAALAAEHGFAAVDAPRRLRIRERLREDLLRREIEQALNTPEKREAWQAAFRDKPSLDQKMLRLGDARAAALLDGRHGRDALAAVSARLRHQRSLAEVEKRLAARTDAAGGGALSGRQLFLLAISFVVCLVGIANAMLMAITERFREIATMKCLGATDGFVLTQFLVEAALQGVAGGLLGMLLGLVLSTAKNAAVFGGYLFAYYPAGALAAAGGISLAAGILVSTLASVYPSWIASRMAPMEAMRVE